MNFLVMPICFLSGALFPLTGLPKALEIIAKLDPLTYGVDGLRGALGGLGHFSMHWTWASLARSLTVLGVAGPICSHGFSSRGGFGHAFSSP